MHRGRQRPALLELQAIRKPSTKTQYRINIGWRLLHCLGPSSTSTKDFLDWQHLPASQPARS